MKFFRPGFSWFLNILVLNPLFSKSLGYTLETLAITALIQVFFPAASQYLAIDSF